MSVYWIGFWTGVSWGAIIGLIALLARTLWKFRNQLKAKGGP